MNKSDISTLVRFNFWANDRLLAACEGLAADEFTRPVPHDPGWGSLRGVLVHVLDTEFGWRAVLQKQAADVILQEDEFPDVAALKAAWEREKAAWLDFVGSLRDANLERGYREDAQRGPRVWQTIVHVVAHGIQHRGEAAWILTGYGASPGELDFGLFLQADAEPPSGG